MKEWPREDPYDIRFRRGQFQNREEAEKEMQAKFDKLKAEGKIPEALQGAIMSDETNRCIKNLVYQSMLETVEELGKLALKTGRAPERSALFLNFSNMTLQVMRTLIQEALELEYDLTLQMENVPEFLRKYKERMK